MSPIELPDMTYSVVAQDGALWLVVMVQVAGGAAVVSRWTTKAAAEQDAQRWFLLAAEEAPA